MRPILRRGVFLVLLMTALCAVPVIAQAAMRSGTILSEGLVYKDVYGVSNGNAYMFNTKNETSENPIREVDLVASDGTVLFQTGYSYMPSEDYWCTPHPTRQYIPSVDLADANAISNQAGGIKVTDSKTKLQGFVNSSGKLVVENADAIAVMPQSDTAIVGHFINGSLQMSLVSLHDGSVLDKVNEPMPIDGIGPFWSSHLDDNGNDVAFAVGGDTEYTEYLFSVNNGRIDIETQSYKVGGTLYDDSSLKVFFDEGMNLVFSSGESDPKIIDGPFSHGSFNNEVITAMAFSEVDYSQHNRYFNLKGDELFSDGKYLNGTVNKLVGTDRYLCMYPIDPVDTKPLSRAFRIDQLDGKNAIELPYQEKEGRVYEYQVCGAYILQYVIEVGSASSTYEAVALLDSSGNVAKTLDGVSWYAFQYLPTSESNPKYYLYDGHDSVSYYDENLELIDSLNGMLIDRDFSLNSQRTYVLTPLYTPGYPQLPRAMYDYGIQPLMFHGYQRVVAGDAYNRTNLNYVTDGNGHYGALDDAGNVALPIEYESLCDLGEAADASKIMVKKDGAWFFMDVSNLMDPGSKPDPEPVPDFSDINSSVSHYEEIAWLASSGITKGFPDGTFRPYEPIARCDMAAFLYRLAGKPEYSPTAEDKARFSDVNDKTYHAKEVWWLASTGISEGWLEADGSRTFRPYVTIKRQDMAAFLQRLSKWSGKPSIPGDPLVGFSDVTSSTEHFDAITWLAANRVSEGWTMPDGSKQFRGMSDVARADMAAFLNRMAKYGLV